MHRSRVVLWNFLSISLVAAAEENNRLYDGFPQLDDSGRSWFRLVTMSEAH